MPIVTDGTLDLRGDFSTAAATFDMLTPTLHRVLFNGTGPQAVALGSTADHPQANRFQNVEIANPEEVTFNQDARVLGQLEFVGRMRNEATLTIPVGGSLLARSGSYLDNLERSIVLGGTRTAEVGSDGVGIPPACFPD